MFSYISGKLYTSTGNIYLVFLCVETRSGVEAPLPFPACDGRSLLPLSALDRRDTSQCSLCKHEHTSVAARHATLIQNTNRCGGLWQLRLAGLLQLVAFRLLAWQL
jgi:hypothetical protein